MNCFAAEVPKIVVGLPTNRRMSQDIRPMYDALELEGDKSVLRSRFVEGVEFWERRASDIARSVKENVCQLGVLGDDMAIENGLLPPSRSMYETMFSGNEPSVYIPPFYYLPQNKVAGLILGDDVWVTLFARMDLKKRYMFPDRLIPAGTIASSYPNLTRALLARFDYDGRLKVAPFEGSIEAVVANRDDPEIVGGVDVVRTGDTMRRFDLIDMNRLMRSCVGLWRSPRYIRGLESPNMRVCEQRMNEVICAIRERLGDIVETCSVPAPAEDDFFAAT